MPKTDTEVPILIDSDCDDAAFISPNKNVGSTYKSRMESLDLYCTDSDDNTLPDVPNVSPEKFNYDFPRSEHIPDIPDIQHASTVRSKRKRRKRRILARKRNNASTYDFVDLTLDDDSTTTGHGHLTSEVMDLTSFPKPIAYFTPVENVTSDSSTMDVTFNTSFQCSFYGNFIKIYIQRLHLDRKIDATK